MNISLYPEDEGIYKSYRIIDGKPRWTIVDDNGDIISRNPTRDELKTLKKELYKPKPTRPKTDFTGIKCYICGGDNLTTKTAFSEGDEKGYRTGRWLCKKCYNKVQNDKPDSCNNLLKSVSDRRTGNQNPDSPNAKGDLGEKLTCIWKGVDNLNDINDDYHSPIDHSPDPITRIIYQTKISWYKSTYKYWKNCLERELHKEFDQLIFYCISKDGKIVERIYIFPKNEIIKRTGISIYKNPTDCSGDPIIPWYEKYRIIDEKIINEINEIWKKILE